MTKHTTTITKRVVSTSSQVTLPSGVTVDATRAQRLLEPYQFISAAALKQGTHIAAGVGAGKSRVLGRVFAWTQLMVGKPLVVFDPTGGVVDNLFDKILRLPPKYQQPLWQHLIYIDAGAKDFLFPSALYYDNSGHDTFFEMANRFPSVLKRIDPELTGAPILGWNSLYECLIHAGKIAVAKKLQLDFVADLIEHPSKYKDLLREVLAAYPELNPSVAYFRALMDPTASGLREKKTGSTKNKLLPFLTDPIRLVTYASQKNRLNWKKLIKQNKVILLDYRHQLDPDHLQFDMVWHLKTLMDALKHRGMAGRGQELMLIIDEITAMLGQRTHDGHALLAEDLQELISRLGRNYGANIVIAHQGLFQVEERIQNLLMGMGNQLIGQLTNPDDAVRVARQFMHYKPYKVKKTENVWHTLHPLPMLSYFGGPDLPYPQVIDQRSIEFSPEEQLLDWVNQLLDLDRFQFLAQIAMGEGGKKGSVKKITIARLDKGQYPQEHILAPLRQALAKRDGLPLVQVLETLYKKRHEREIQKPKNPPQKSATLKSTYVPADNLPTPDAAAPISSPIREPGEANEPDDEQVFQ